MESRGVGSRETPSNLHLIAVPSLVFLMIPPGLGVSTASTMPTRDEFAKTILPDAGIASKSDKQRIGRYR